MTNPSIVNRERGTLDSEEVTEMFRNAGLIKNEYFRLRVKALISIAKKFGKRRAEIATLERSDLKVENNQLYVTFTLRKKHKKGLFQFIKILQKTNSSQLEKSLSELKHLWEAWTETEEGYHIREEKRTKSVSTKDVYAKIIIEYLDFLDSTYSGVKYIFPSGTEVFGKGYMVFPDEHLSGRQLLRLIKPLSSTAWLHLFRETKGAEIAKARGRTLDAVYEVRETLDLENEATAFRYVRRYAVQEMKAEKGND